MRLLSYIICALLTLSINAPSVVLAVFSEFSGQVVGVIDGDTIDVLHNGQAERIRLNGIDCPERGQAYGKKAKQFTSGLVFGKQVRVNALKKDRHGRTVADVLLLDGTSVSHELAAL